MDRRKLADLTVIGALIVPIVGFVIGAIGAAAKLKWLLWLGLSLPFAVGAAFALYLSLLMLAALSETGWDRFLFGWAASMPFFLLMLGWSTGLVLIAIVLIARIIAGVAEVALSRFTNPVE